MSQMTHECFADEIAIDFPSVGNVVDRMRTAFLGEHVDADVLRAEVSLSQREAFAGHVVPLKVPVRITCPNCGGRGETWTEPCGLCLGTGESLFQQALRRHRCRRASPTARCVRFRLKSPDARIDSRRAARRDPFFGDLIRHH